MLGYKHLSFLLVLAFAFLQIASINSIDFSMSLDSHFPQTEMSFDYERKVLNGNADVHIAYKTLSDELIQVHYQFNRKTKVNPIQFDYQYNIRANTDGSSDIEAIGILPPNIFHVGEAKIRTNSPSLVHYPSAIKVGAKLPDANFNYSIVSPNIEFTHEGKIIERKVLKTFTANYKKLQLKGFLLSAKVIRNASLNGNPFETTTTQLKEWFVPGIGMVKQERNISTQPIGFVDTHKQENKTETIVLKDLKLNL